MITEEHRRHYLHQIVEAWDQVFDPGSGFLCPFGPEPRHARSAQTEGRHAQEESMHYALALLELAERSRQGRAEAIITRIIDLPEASASQGLAMTLLLIWHRHRRRLPRALLEKIVLTVVGSARRILAQKPGRSPLPPGTRINDLFVLLSVAKITDDEDLMSRAVEQLDRLQENFGLAGPLLRAGDPDDAAAGLAGLHAIDNHISDPRVTERMEVLLSRFWREVADVFYAPDQAAAHHAAEPGLLAFMVEKASRGAVRGRIGSGRETFAALFVCVMNVEAPPMIFADLTGGAGNRPEN